jgi:flagellar motor component MotA
MAGDDFMNIVAITNSLLGLAVVGVMVLATFLYLGCKTVNIYDTDFKKSVIAVIGGGILAFTVNTAISEFAMDFLFNVIKLAGFYKIGMVFVPFLIHGLNIVLPVLAYIWAIKVVFNASWGEAFMAWAISIILGAVALFAMGFVFSRETLTYLLDVLFHLF